MEFNIDAAVFVMPSVPSSTRKEIVPDKKPSSKKKAKKKGDKKKNTDTAMPTETNSSAIEGSRTPKKRNKGRGKGKGDCTETEMIAKQANERAPRGGSGPEFHNKSADKLKEAMLGRGDVMPKGRSKREPARHEAAFDTHDVNNLASEKLKVAMLGRRDNALRGEMERRGDSTPDLEEVPPNEKPIHNFNFAQPLIIILTLEENARSNKLKEAMLMRREIPRAGESRSRRFEDNTLNWWRHLEVDDPISLEPLRNLRYEPFELSADGTVVYHFDGKLLANYLISSAQFLHPVSRRPITRRECILLDSYLKRNRLGGANVTRVFDEKDSKSGEIADLRTEAQIIMDSIFGASNAPPRPPIFSLSDVSGASVMGDQGWRMIDDDERREELAEESATSVTWPELTMPQDSSHEDSTNINQWRPQLAAPPPTLDDLRNETQLVLDSIAPRVLNHRAHNPASIYSDGRQNATIVAPLRRQPPQGKRGGVAEREGMVMMSSRAKDPDNKRKKEARPVVWCDGLGWIGIPSQSGPREREDVPSQQRQSQKTPRAVPSVPQPQRSARTVRRSGMVTAKVTLRPVREDRAASINSKVAGSENMPATGTEGDGCDQDHYSLLGTLSSLHIDTSNASPGVEIDDEWERVSDAGSVVSDGSYCLI